MKTYSISTRCVHRSLSGALALWLGTGVSTEAGVVLQIDFGDAIAVGSPGGNWNEVFYGAIDPSGDGFVSNLTDFVTGQATTVQMTLDDFATGGTEGEGWTNTGWVVSEAADDGFQPLATGAIITLDGLDPASTYTVEIAAPFNSTAFPPTVFDPTDFQVNGAFTDQHFDPANTSVTPPFASDDWSLSASHNANGVNDWMIWEGVTAGLGRITIDVIPEAGTFGTFGSISAIRVVEFELVPEPGAGLMMMVAVCGFLARRPRSKK